MSKKKVVKEKIHPSVICTGIVVLGALEAYALSLGHNGWILASVMTIIGLVIGVIIPTPKILKGGE